MCIELNKIYNEDCNILMGKISNGFIDLTITSPPYDDLRLYDGTHEWGEVVWKLALENLYRITKTGGVVVWVVGDSTVNGSETGTSFKQALFAIECGFRLHDTMIYQKDNPPPVGGGNRYYQSFEYMFIFSKGSPSTFNPIKQPRRNKHNDNRTHRVKGFVRDKAGGFKKKLVAINEVVKINNVWKYVVGGGNSVAYGTKHPAGFPEKMVADHLVSWSNEGDIVFDPFMGSGTTAKVAKIKNRKYIGSEISKMYCEIAEKRISDCQLSLFTES